MLSTGAIIFAASLVSALFLSSVWGEMTFGDHAKLPRVFSFDMDRAKRSSRIIVLWSTPALCAFTLGFAGWILLGLPKVEEVEHLVILFDAWVAGTGLMFLALQVFTLWRLNKWAQR